MDESRESKILVSKNGPYLVTGDIPLTVQVITPNEEGFSWEWKEDRSFNVKSNYRLCRCGQSNNKPFCDDSHLRIGFDGKETATRASHEKQAERYSGPSLILKDATNFCAFARFCDPGGKIWRLIGETDRPEIRDLAIREATQCPSGRLVLEEKRTGKEIEPKLPASIGIVEDPALNCSGPLWIRGGITIESGDGTLYERRNRVTLCRCGASSNKPFCDGSHASISFQDGLLKHPRA
jgi:CDGSH-type Zn-finger protein